MIYYDYLIVSESFDVVVIVGALSIGNMPVEIIDELWQACKPGKAHLDQYLLHAHSHEDHYTVCSQFKTCIRYNTQTFFFTTGGYVCMTTRGNADNLEYKAEMESVIRAMEEKKKWSRVAVTVVDKWEKAVSEDECGYICGVVYLYQKAY